jgi:hypothetical protein
MDLKPDLSTEQLYLVVASGVRRKAFMLDMVARFLSSGRCW